MSADVLKEATDVGNDLNAVGYHQMAATTLFFYDFVLTLPDEIKYAWHGRKSWVFAVFLANRYLPMAFQFWLLYGGSDRNPPLPYLPTPRQWATVQHSHNRCNKTAFLEVLALVGSTFLAQVVLTLRVYAVTGKNWMATSCFSTITTSQLVLGLYAVAHMAREGSQPILPVPLTLYEVCIFVRHRSLEIGFTAISLVYDLLAFSVVVYLVVRSNVTKTPIPRLFRTVAQDATYYFLVIFTSHLVLMLFLSLANPTLQLLPATGNTVYLPVMVTRLMLSLKKATASQKYAWSLGEPTTHTNMIFAERQGVIATKDEMPLDTFASTHRGTQSQA